MCVLAGQRVLVSVYRSNPPKPGHLGCMHLEVGLGIFQGPFRWLSVFSWTAGIRFRFLGRYERYEQTRRDLERNMWEIFNLTYFA